MNRWARLALLCLLAGLCAASTCENQDYLAAPNLVIPETAEQAASAVEVSNPYDGLTTVDYLVWNTGDTDMQIRLTATTLSINTEDAGVADVSGQGVAIEGSKGTEEFVVESGKRKAGRFSAVQLGTGVSVTLKAECLSDSCAGYVEWVVLLGQVECRTQEDCSADEICDEISRTCVEAPSAGCSAAGAGAASNLWCLIGFLLLVVVRSPQAWRTFLVIAVAAVPLLTPSTANAQRAAFDRPTAQMSVGPGVKRFTGPIGEVTQPGVSLEVVNAIQYRNLGFQVTVGTAYFLTTQPSPPLSKGVQSYSLRAGPRFVMPFWVFQAYLDAEYERFGLISNSLVRITGDETNFHAAGARLGLRWVPGPFFINAHSGYTEIFGLKAGLVSVGLSFGLEGSM